MQRSFKLSKKYVFIIIVDPKCYMLVHYAKVLCQEKVELKKVLLYCMKCNLMLNVPHGYKNGAFLLKFCRVLKVEAKYTSSCNLLKDYSCIWLLASLFIKLFDAKLAVLYMIRFMKALGIYQRQSNVAWIWNLIKWASPTLVLVN